MFPSVAYPEKPYVSYWGPPTASSDFCEENYVITPYIGEFINTLTNLNYCLFCYHGLRTLQKQRRLTWMTASPHLGLLGVGVFSAGFHITMREWPQLADDLSMVFPTAFIFLRILRFEAADAKAANKRTMIFFAILAVIYTIHLNINNPHMHSITFGVGVHYIRYKTWELLSRRIKDDATRKHLKKMAVFGAVSFAFGFILWVIDQLGCRTLTGWKRAMGMPWSFVLEFHGWWHIFTGIGAYIFIVLTDVLTAGGSERETTSQVDFGWPANWVIGNTAAGQTASVHVNGPVVEVDVKTD
jgi:dihydroceramidase